ncbi:hypothetical protein RINTU1_09060 [Candidatus Regiella insecticola]|uniref:Uncharacterized protein n=1 Tax=Candidatus Regiella insecticola TaxID=138073 RepID=A0A6L2ZLE6_9ENTR|nr:hypothetical protein RINTU1_09060 [Candidatus Regiella insecticola]
MIPKRYFDKLLLFLEMNNGSNDIIVARRSSGQTEPVRKHRIEKP